MKFKIRVSGKDSIGDALLNKGVKLKKLVSKFLEDGEGGNDAVTVEFDTDAGTCVVVPVKKKS